MAKRVDANQKEIVKALRDFGASVQIISDVGKGCPDIIVGWQGDNYLVEIKKDKGVLTPHEIAFFSSWKGQVCMIRSADTLLDIFKAKQKMQSFTSDV